MEVCRICQVNEANETLKPDGNPLRPGEQGYCTPCREMAIRRPYEFNVTDHIRARSDYSYQKLDRLPVKSVPAD